MSNTLVVPKLLCPNVFTINASDEVPNTGEYLTTGDFHEAGYSLGMIKANGTYAFNSLAYYFAKDHTAAYSELYHNILNPYNYHNPKYAKAALLGTQAVFNALTDITKHGLVLPGVKEQTIKVVKAVFDIYDDEEALADTIDRD